MSVRLGGATVADEAIVSIVRGAVAGVPGARLDLPGRVSRVIPGRRGPVEWTVKGRTIEIQGDQPGRLPRDPAQALGLCCGGMEGVERVQ